MSNQERESLFAEAAKTKVVEKEEADRRRANGGMSFEQITYAALHLNDYSSMRFLGNPAESRLGDATSPKIVCYGMITGDDDRKFRAIWPGMPNSEEGKNWILSKVFNKVLSYKWDNEANERLYYNKTSHPTIFNRVFKNGRPDITFEKGWNPSKVVVANVIDRDMMDWHIENKHAALISKKVSESKQGAMFYEPGIPYTVYNELWEEIVSTYGDWENFDIVLYKTNSKPFYKVYHGNDEFKKLAGKNSLFDLEKNPTYMVDSIASLTPEQRAWERYDIDKLFPISSYGKIESKLKLFFIQVDEVFNTHFYDELEGLVADEKAAKAAAKAAKEASATTTPVTDNVLTKEDFAEEAPASTETFVDTPAPSADAAEKAGNVFDSVPDEAAPATPPAEAPTRRRAAKAAPVASIDWDGLAESFSGIATMTEEEKKMVVSYDEDKGTFAYGEGVSLFSCPNSPECTMKTPDAFSKCPACGVTFE